MEKKLRRCSRCKQEKENTHIYSRRLDGKPYFYCSDCGTERSRKYRQTKAGKEAYYRAVLKYNSKNKEKYSCWHKVHYALKNGTIKRPKRCKKCRAEVRLDAHHEDYSKPLLVMWLCRRCHISLRK